MLLLVGGVDCTPQGMKIRGNVCHVQCSFVKRLKAHLLKYDFEADCTKPVLSTNGNQSIYTVQSKTLSKILVCGYWLKN